MARGRKPVPAEIARARGNPGRRKIRDTESAALPLDETQSPAAPVVEATPHPSVIEDDPGAIAVWQAVAGDLIRSNFIRRTDRPALARWCAYLAKWIEANAAVIAGGTTYETDSQHGKMRRIDPNFAVMMRLERMMVVLEDRLPLNPASRQRIAMGLAGAPASAPAPGASGGAAVSGVTGGSAGEPAASPIGFLQ